MTEHLRSFIAKFAGDVFNTEACVSDADVRNFFTAHRVELAVYRAGIEALVMSTVVNTATRTVLPAFCNMLAADENLRNLALQQLINNRPSEEKRKSGTLTAEELLCEQLIAAITEQKAKCGPKVFDSIMKTGLGVDLDKSRSVIVTYLVSFVLKYMVARLLNAAMCAALDQASANLLKEHVTSDFSRAVASISSANAGGQATFNSFVELDAHCSNWWWPFLSRPFYWADAVYAPRTQFGLPATRAVLEDAMHKASLKDIMVTRACWETLWQLRAFTFAVPTGDIRSAAKNHVTGLVYAVKKLAVIGATTFVMTKATSWSPYSASVLGKTLALLFLR